VANVYRHCDGYPDTERLWFEDSNIVAVLETTELEKLAKRLEGKGYQLSRFTEPDMDGLLTAICVEPNAWRHLSSLPLAR